jgi:hypothetical protein
MPEPDNDAEEHVERKVVYETRSSSSTKNQSVAFIMIAVIAIALIVWIVMQMR